MFGLWAREHSFRRSSVAALPRGLLFHFCNPRPARQKPHFRKSLFYICKQHQEKRTSQRWNFKTHLQIACIQQLTVLIARLLQVDLQRPQRLSAGQHAASNPRMRRLLPKLHCLSGNPRPGERKSSSASIHNHKKIENKIGGLRNQGHTGCAYVQLTSRRYSAVDIVERSAVVGRSGSSVKHVSSSPCESPSS